jgi:hypothetical protein
MVATAAAIRVVDVLARTAAGFNMGHAHRETHSKGTFIRCHCLFPKRHSRCSSSLIATYCLSILCLAFVH